MATMEEIEKKRADRREAFENSKTEQAQKDLEAIDALEEASEPLHTMTANGYKPGVAVKAAFRAPTSAEYKRYADMVGKALQKNDSVARKAAQEMLAAACLVYPPEGDDRKAMLEAFPGVLLSVAIEAVKVVELRVEDEGKD